MQELNDIIVATDFSAGGELAVRRAARLASDRGSRLHVLHILNSSLFASLREIFHPKTDVEARLVDDARANLTAVVARLVTEHGLAADADVRVGVVLDELLAASAHTDLLVLGARGTNLLRDLLLGTTAKRLLYKATQPVLVVKGEALEDYRRVLVPVDFSPASVAALRLAAHIAPAAELHLVHVFDVPFEGKLRLAGVNEDEVLSYRVRARQQAQDAMMRLVADSGVDRFRLSHVLVHGDASLEILNKQESLCADLVVIGKQGQNATADLLLGSVTRHVLSDVTCDVLITQPKVAP